MSGLTRLAGTLAFAIVSGITASALAQAEPPPADADGGAAPPTGALPPTAPTAAPQPEPAPTPPPSGPPPAGQYGGPPPNGQYGGPYGAPPPPPEGYAPAGSAYGEPPPPPEKPSEGFEMPPISFRIDPFNWLLEGRLGVEAEVGILKFMSLEIVPVFVANEKPPTFNLGSADSTLRQKSNGIGPMSGAQFDVAFWLDGKTLHGYVIRVGITDEGYTYRTENDAGAQVDSVSHTERRAFFMFGSHARWGAFTIAGGIGLGVELNKEERCFPNGANSVNQATNSGCNNQLLIATDPLTQNVVDLNGPLHPMYLMGRFSLGVAFD